MRSTLGCLHGTLILPRVVLEDIPMRQVPAKHWCIGVKSLLCYCVMLSRCWSGWPMPLQTHIYIYMYIHIFIYTYIYIYIYIHIEPGRHARIGRQHGLQW